MTVYRNICITCKKEFFCKGKACNKHVLTTGSNRCHCPNCTIKENMERKNNNSASSLYYEECPKVYLMEELTIDEL
jgi:hypothetical protein